MAANSIQAEENAATVVAGSETGGKFPAGSYQIFVAKEASILTFTADGRIVGKKVDGGKVIEGVYTTMGDEIVLSNMKEHQRETEERCAGEGKYKWSFDGKALSFTKIADDCEGRAMALTANPLAPIEGKEVKRSEADTGSYLHCGSTNTEPGAVATGSYLR